MRASACHAALAVVCFIGAVRTPARGDGFVLDRLGHYVPEREQRAFIKWDGTREQLFVATRADATAGSSLWIVPVPGAPVDVRAEPVASMPSVAFERAVVPSARRLLQEAGLQALFLDTGFLPGMCLFFLGCGEEPANKSTAVSVHAHTERLGMVVELLTGQSASALNAYLTAKKVPVRVESLHAIAPYIGAGYTLVCGWAAEPGSQAAVRAVRIEFPSRRAYFPLRPTRVYAGQVETGIYVRGWVYPRADSAMTDLVCEHVVARPSETSDQVMARAGIAPISPGEVRERMTRMRLGAHPGAWTNDLELEAGAPAAICVADAIDQLGAGRMWLVSAALGAGLACLLTSAVLPRMERQPADWGWAACGGAAIALSIFATAFIFTLWWRTRDWPRGFGKMVALVAGLHLLCVGGISVLLRAWLAGYT
jgi:hypothetical protein